MKKYTAPALDLIRLSMTEDIMVVSQENLGPFDALEQGKLNVKSIKDMFNI